MAVNKKASCFEFLLDEIVSPFHTGFNTTIPQRDCFLALNIKIVCVHTLFCNLYLVDLTTNHILNSLILYVGPTKQYKKAVKLVVEAKIKMIFVDVVSVVLKVHYATFFTGLHSNKETELLMK